MQFDKSAQCALEIMSSLQLSLQQAGGCVLTIENLREMTGEELLLYLANNNVRFIYNGKSKYLNDEVHGLV